MYAGLVFNRPIEQILTYGVPARLAGLIRVGQRGSCAAGTGGTGWRRDIVVEVLLLDDRLEQVMLVGEVDVERALRHAGDAGNFAHAGAVEAEIEKYASRSVEDLLPLGGIFLARPRCGFAQGLGARCNHLFSVTGSCAAAATGW